MVTLVVIVMLAGPCNGWLDDGCAGDYSPCYCEDFTVYCRDIPAVSVKSAFSRITTSQHLYKFYLFLSADPGDINSTQLMADLIGNVTTFQTIDINCWYPSYINQWGLVIDANAFRSTKSVTRELSILNCDLSQLNWSFISNFTNLQSLFLSGNDNFIASFYTLPSASLPRLTDLAIRASSGLNDGFLNLSLRYPEPLKQGLSLV